MTIFAVMMMHDLGQRWIDSLWADAERASERVRQLTEHFTAMGNSHKLKCWKTTLFIQDAKLAISPDEQEDADSDGYEVAE